MDYDAISIFYILKKQKQSINTIKNSESKKNEQQ